MYQIDNSTAAAAQPASTPAGSSGFFTDGNPATGVAATIVPAEWLNAVMMELVNIVTAGGLTPTKNAFNQVLTAIRALGKQPSVLADTGAVNAYAATNVPPLVVGTWVDYVVQRVRIANANTGASTFSPDGLAAIPIYGLGLQPLQGGELRAGGVAAMMRITVPGVNGGNPVCVLLDCFGGAQQVAPASQSQHAVQLGQVGHGQCRLTVASSTQLKLSPRDGNNLIINGVPQQVPAAGVTVSNSGLSANTTYYVYAYMNAGVMTLEPVTTTRALGTNGVQIKSGDATRTLVGMVRTNASSQFVDSATQVFCLNWFNRQLKRGIATLLTDVLFTNTTAGEITSGLRVEFLTWNDDGGTDGGITQATGRISNNTQGGASTMSLYIDGAPFGALQEMQISGTTMLRMPFVSPSLGNGLSEGYHLATLYGYTSSGSQTTLVGGANNIVQVRG